MKIRKSYVFGAAAVLGVAAALGVALSGQDTSERDVYYTKNVTVQSHIGGYATVGYANEADADKGLHPVRVTVRVAGGTFDKDLRVYSGSTVIFDNGNIGGMLYLRNGSTAIVNGGTIGNRSDPYTVSSVDVYEDSTVTLGGGHFGNDIRASDNSMINLTGGTFNGLLRDANIYLADRSTLNIFGTGLRKALTNVTSDAESEAGTYRQYKLSGTLADGRSLSGRFVYVVQGSRAQVNLLAPGAVPPPRQTLPTDPTTFWTHSTTFKTAMPAPAFVGYPDRKSHNSGTNPASPTIHLVSGGSVGELSLFNSSTLILTGGTVTADLLAADNTVATLSSGRIRGAIYVSEHSRVTLRGGSVKGGIRLFGQGTANVYGGSLSGLLDAEQNSTLSLYGSGLKKTQTGSIGQPPDGEKEYTLSGMLADGSPLNGLKLAVSGNAKVNFIKVHAAASPSRQRFVPVSS